MVSGTPDECPDRMELFRPSVSLPFSSGPCASSRSQRPSSHPIADGPRPSTCHRRPRPFGSRRRRRPHARAFGLRGLVIATILLGTIDHHGRSMGVDLRRPNRLRSPIRRPLIIALGLKQAQVACKTDRLLDRFTLLGLLSLACLDLSGGRCSSEPWASSLAMLETALARWWSSLPSCSSSSVFDTASTRTVPSSGWTSGWHPSTPQLLDGRSGGGSQAC